MGYKKIKKGCQLRREPNHVSENQWKIRTSYKPANTNCCPKENKEHVSLVRMPKQG